MVPLWNNKTCINDKPGMSIYNDNGNKRKWRTGLHNNHRTYTMCKILVRVHSWGCCETCKRQYGLFRNVKPCTPMVLTLPSEI